MPIELTREQIQQTIRAYAENKIVEVQQRTTTSGEAMADIFDYGSRFYIGRGLLGNNQEEEFVEDMAKILAGVGEWPGFQTSDGTQVTHFDDSGFRTEFQDGSNQVQHFAAAVQAGYQYGELGYIAHRLYRPDSPQDTALNDMAIKLGLSLDGIGTTVINYVRPI